jgi:hypothetical protein
MPTIKIDDTSYDLDSLNDQAKQSLQMLKVVDVEIQRLQAQMAIAQTARAAYMNALKGQLPTPLEQVQAQGDTIKFS